MGPHCSLLADFMNSLELSRMSSRCVALPSVNTDFIIGLQVVKVHESTLRKRLVEFGETSASQLTVEEFMNVDLDAMTDEMDPPSFKAARKKDRELLEKLKDNDLKEFSDLEEKIEKGLEERRTKVKGPYASYSKESSPSDSPASGSDTDNEKELEETQKFIQEETLNVIGECLSPTGAVLDLNSPR